jgi:hypothetical protein
LEDVDRVVYLITGQRLPEFSPYDYHRDFVKGKTPGQSASVVLEQHGWYLKECAEGIFLANKWKVFSQGGQG